MRTRRNPDNKELKEQFENFKLRWTAIKKAYLENKISLDKYNELLKIIENNGTNKVIDKFLKNNHGYITTKEIENVGINKTLIPELIKKGILRKVAYGIYIDNNLIEDEYGGNKYHLVGKLENLKLLVLLLYKYLHL